MIRGGSWIQGGRFSPGNRSFDEGFDGVNDLLYRALLPVGSQAIYRGQGYSYLLYRGCRCFLGRGRLVCRLGCSSSIVYYGSTALIAERGFNWHRIPATVAE